MIKKRGRSKEWCAFLMGIALLWAVGGGEAPGQEEGKAVSPRVLFETKCSICHPLTRILRQLEPLEGWSSIVAREREKAPFWISQQEAELITEYLQALKEHPKMAMPLAEAPTPLLGPEGAMRAPNPSVTSLRYEACEETYLGNECMLSGIPFFEQVSRMQLPANFDLEALASLTSGDAAWFSRYHLNSLFLQSGMGLHLIYGPMIGPQAKEEGVTAEEFLQSLFNKFSESTGLKAMPKGLYPIFTEFASGEPLYMSLPDFNDLSTLRWDPTKSEKIIKMGALGQALLNQTLWAEYFLSANHDEALLGNTADEGFLGAVLILEAINKMLLLENNLAYDHTDLGRVNPFEYEAKPKYFPHEVAIEFSYGDGKKPPEPTGYYVTDSTSKLKDQASLLWATSEFYYLSDPKIEDNYDEVFGSVAEGALFSAEPHRLALGLTAVVFKNMLAMHFNPLMGTFVSKYYDGQQDSVIKATDAGMALIALSNTYFRLQDVEEMKEGAKNIIKRQALFLAENLQGADGGFDEEYNLALKKPSAGPKTLASQAVAIRGLLSAYKVTGDENFLDAALGGYKFMNDHLFSSVAGLYRSEEGADLSVYTPFVVGSTLGALREVALATADSEPLGRFKTFFNSIFKENGFQLAELAPTGETLESVKSILTPDADGDGIRKPPYGGGRFGVAPVFAGEARVATP